MPGERTGCIVLGAGIAGVAAVRELVEQGWSVLILEGNDRVGGRMYSRPAGGGLTLEGGAEYVHVAPDRTRKICRRIGNRCHLVEVATHKRYRRFWQGLCRQGFETWPFSNYGEPFVPGRNRTTFPPD